MSGRSCWHLLAISTLALTCHAGGQSRDFKPESDLSIPTPRPVRTAIAKPIPALPRRPAPGTFGFQDLTRTAGTIFAGTVVAIKRQPATHGQAVETVAITFRVENAIRGVTPGQELTISQWIGLWSSGQHYRIGERALLFLYPQSKLGLTSCVAPPLGRFAVDPAGRVLLSAQQLAAFQKDPVLGGKSRAILSDFAWAVRRASEEE